MGATAGYGVNGYAPQMMSYPGTQGTSLSSTHVTRLDTLACLRGRSEDLVRTHITADLTLFLTRAFLPSTPALTNFRSSHAPLASLPREKYFAGVRP